MGSLRGSSGKYAACGWAVANMDLDGGEEPWYGGAGNMPIDVDVQRTIERAEIWAL